MKPDEQPATALVLLGHGTTLNADSSSAVYQHAEVLRRTGRFAEVLPAFWKQEPHVTKVLDATRCPRIVIVPLFISEGYFSELVLPRALGFRGSASDAGVPEGAGSVGEFSRILRRTGRTLYYCEPAGTHPRMTQLLLARAKAVVQSAPFPRAPAPGETTLFVAGHGTERNENSRQVIDRQVELVRDLGIYAGVHPVFLEEKPAIPECYNLAGTRNIVVVPFFIGEGLHVKEDIPVLLGETPEAVKRRLARQQPTFRNPTERKGKLVWYAASVGTAPEVVDLILERVREAERHLASQRSA